MEAPFAAFLAPAVEAAFLGRDAADFADVRLTGADATDAGILAVMCV